MRKYQQLIGKLQTQGWNMEHLIQSYVLRYNELIPKLKIASQKFVF